MKLRIVSLVFLLAGFAVGADETEWKIGLASASITPSEPVFMAGYASRDHAYEGVAADLHAKALALVDSEGHRAVLITTDLIGFTAEVGEPICDRIIEKTGLKRSDILINSSHTHTGPSLTLKTDPTTKMDAGQAARQAAYTRHLQDEMVRIAIEALESADRPAEIRWGTGLAHFIMNRREYTGRGVILGVNPRGPVDRSVPVLRVSEPGENGKLLAIVFQAACHNTTLGGNFYRITGDFAGYAQAFIEEKHPGVQAMFMIGCGGDANPHPRGELEFSKEHGKALGAEVVRVLENGKALKPVGGPLRTAFAHAELPLQKPLQGKALSEFKLRRGGWRGWVASQMEQYREEGRELPTHYRAPFSVWRFGDGLTLVGMSGEVVVDFIFRLEEEIGPLDLWIAAYCHDVYGYLPSARVLREGGYETRGLYAGGIGFFAPEAEEVAVSTIRELAAEAGRDLP